MSRRIRIQEPKFYVVNLAGVRNQAADAIYVLKTTGSYERDLQDDILVLSRKQAQWARLTLAER